MFKPNRRFVAEVARGQKAKAYVEKVAEEAAKQSRSRVPVDSGKLRDSISSGSEMTEDGWRGLVGAGDREAFYWGLVEFGPRGAPYLRPGTQAALSKFKGRFAPSRK